MTNRSYQQYCGLAYALDIVGERWTLLIVRELVPGPRRFKDLLDGLPGISTNLLAERLKSLAEQGLLTQRTLPPPAGSTVYELTPLGRSLEPMLLELGRWGSQFVPPTWQDATLLRLGSYALTFKTFFRPELAQGIDETYELRIGGEVLQVKVKDGHIDVRQGQVFRARRRHPHRHAHLHAAAAGGAPAASRHRPGPRLRRRRPRRPRPPPPNVRPAPSRAA